MTNERLKQIKSSAEKCSAIPSRDALDLISEIRRLETVERSLKSTLRDRDTQLSLTTYKSQEAENKRLRALLKRAKATFEPFPICSDLRSMTQRLRENHTETEADAIEKGFAEHKAKFRKLHDDITKALERSK